MKKALVFASLVLVAGLVHAQNLGNVEDQMRRIADVETDRFMSALKETVQEHFAGDAAGRNAFVSLLQEKLDLDTYASEEDEAAVKAFEDARRVLERHFVNADQLFAGLRTQGELKAAEVDPERP